MDAMMFGYLALVVSVAAVLVHLYIFFRVNLPKSQVFLFVGFVFNAFQKITLVITQKGDAPVFQVLDHQFFPFAEGLMYLVGLVSFLVILNRSNFFESER